jgi:hypothetical protein
MVKNALGDYSPCLVEVGARMHGSGGPEITEAATGLKPWEMVYDVMLNEGKLFEELVRVQWVYFHLKTTSE